MNNIDKTSPVVTPMPEEGRMVFELMTEENMTPNQVVEYIKDMNKAHNTNYISTSIDSLRKVLMADLRLIDIFIEKRKARGEKTGGKTHEERQKLAACIEACM